MKKKQIILSPQTLILAFMNYSPLMDLGPCHGILVREAIGLDRIQTKFSVQDFLTLFLELSIFHYILGFASVFVGENLKNSAEGKSKR